MLGSVEERAARPSLRAARAHCGVQIGRRDDRAAPAGDGHTAAGTTSAPLEYPEYPYAAAGSASARPPAAVFSPSAFRAARPIAAAAAAGVWPDRLARRAVFLSIAAPLRAAVEYNTILRRDHTVRRLLPIYRGAPPVVRPLRAGFRAGHAAARPIVALRLHVRTLTRAPRCNAAQHCRPQRHRATE